MSENEEIMNETENETMAAEVEAVETVETEAAEVEAADEVSDCPLTDMLPVASFTPTTR